MIKPTVYFSTILINGLGKYSFSSQPPAIYFPGLEPINLKCISTIAWNEV